jgi:hypothetical protein
MVGDAARRSDTFFAHPAAVIWKVIRMASIMMVEVCIGHLLLLLTLREPPRPQPSERPQGSSKRLLEQNVYLSFMKCLNVRHFLYKSKAGAASETSRCAENCCDNKTLGGGWDGMSRANSLKQLALSMEL